MYQPHGGNPYLASLRSSVPISSLLDASASLVPMRPLSAYSPCIAERFRYPDPLAYEYRECLSVLHDLPPDYFLAGNGAAELISWAARDAANLGSSVLLSPGFADYERALKCWHADYHFIPLTLNFSSHSQPFPYSLSADVIWINNPHNPTGQLWDRKSLEPLLHIYKLVIVDEAFLPIVPGGESESLVPLVADYSNLIVIRSLTKLFGIAGVRLGYAVAHPERLHRWFSWRDPWAVNSLALAIGSRLIRDQRFYHRWCTTVHQWVARESYWLTSKFDSMPGLRCYPSSANFCLIRGFDGRCDVSLVFLREELESKYSILLRDCRSFAGLGDSWLRIGYQSRAGNRRIVRAMRAVLSGRHY